jgi:hypothetical protein
MLERNSFVILSAELSGCTAESNNNATATLVSWLMINGYCYKPVTGVYKSSKERSFVIPVECQADIDALAALASNMFLQESILYVNGLTKEATLLFANAKPLTIGKWTQVESIGHLVEDASYTLDNTNVYACI